MASILPWDALKLLGYVPFILFIVLAYIVVTAVQRRYFSPISDIPGPFSPSPLPPSTSYTLTLETPQTSHNTKPPTHLLQVTVSVNPWAIHRNQLCFGKTAADYDPTRWLDPDQASRIDKIHDSVRRGI